MIRALKKAIRSCFHSDKLLSKALLHCTEFSSFYKTYIQKFFSHQEVSTVHYYFTEWVFQASPEQLCEAMKFKCCTPATHTETCEQK